MKLENIRNYEKLFLNICIELFNEWKDYWYQIQIYTFNDLYKLYYNKFILNNLEHFFILIGNNTVYGYGCIVINEFPNYIPPKNSIFLTDIYIKKKYRGNGLSKILIHLLIIEAKKYKKEILIGVDKNIFFLHNLYKKNGFKYIEEINCDKQYLIYKLSRFSV